MENVTVAQLKEELLSAEPKIDIERLQFMMEVLSKTEGQPEVIRRAMVFDKVCSEKTIYIDHYPIVGTLTKYKYGGSIQPELGARWMAKVETMQIQRGPEIPLNKEEKECLKKTVEYWKDRNVFNRTKEIISETRGVDIGLLSKLGVVTEVTPGGLMDVVPDFARPLNMGLKGILEEIEAQKSKLDIGDLEEMKKLYFYDAATISLKAVGKLAHRYASLAREMAQRESGARKCELERIAQTCDRVPMNPARDFLEALQSVWFCIVASWIEHPKALVAPLLRFSQYMYPFYKRDKEQGKVSDEEVIELLQILFLRINGLAVALSPNGRAYSSTRLGCQLSLGGLSPDGGDATNELDWLILEAQLRIKLPEPLINVMYHDQLSEGFLLKCIDLIKTGVGQPAFQDVNKAMARHLYHDKTSVEEARDMAIAGCVQSVIPGHMYFHWENYLNTAKMLELVFHNGTDPLSGIKIGLETGEVDSIQSYEELYQAVIEQLKYFIHLMRDCGRVSWNVVRDFPNAFASAALSHDCVKSGKDAADGGTKYAVGNGVSMVAVVDLANSLAAIKKLVFEGKKFTLRELKEALRANFNGFEDIYQMCLNAPKYGNDDLYVDLIVKDIYDICWKEHQRFPDFLGRPVKPMAYSVVAHSALGRFTGALPCGRKALVSLTDASTSAQPGTDRNGPTALIKSSARVLDNVKYGGNHFNMKFHPSALEGIDQAKKFLQMMKTYFELGGYHVQFNCVSSETLKEAQLHPGRYRDLVVRVAGFSAFFVTLDKLTQDELIKRTELRM